MILSKGLDADLDPDVRTYLALSGRDHRSIFEKLTVAQARAAFRASQANHGLPTIETVETCNDNFAGRLSPIPVRRYFPNKANDAARPAIMFIHGGGWVLGDLDTYDAVCSHIAVATDMQVIIIEYRRAPEHPFPAAIEDAVDAHMMLINRAQSWNVDPRRIILMGDGTGGTTALVTALHAREMCRPMPMAQVLFYPVCDLRGETDSHTAVKNVPFTGATMAWLKQHYCTSGIDIVDWRNSPQLVDNLVGLSPTFIAVAQHDPLRDEALALEARLVAAGCTTEMRYLAGQIHGYLNLGGVIGEARRSIAAAAAFIEKIMPA
jgi:acetyl esterase